MRYLHGRFVKEFFLGIVFLLWGPLVLLSTQTKSSVAAMTIRMLLRVMEAVVTPGISIMMALWYTKSGNTNGQTLSYCVVGLGEMISGFTTPGFAKPKETTAVPKWPKEATLVPKWAAFYLTVSVLIMLWAIVTYYFLAGWQRLFSEEQKHIAVNRVSSDMVGIKSEKFKWYQVRSALMDPKTYLLFLATFATSIPTGMFSRFSTDIIRDFGFSSYEAKRLDVVRNVFQMMGIIGARLIVTKIKNTLIVMCTFSNIVCFVASACLVYLPDSVRWGRLVAMWFTNFQFIGFVLGLVIIWSNIGGYTKKIFTLCLIFVAFCAGNIVGPHFVHRHEALRYTTATKAMMVSYRIKLVAHLALGTYMVWDNRRRNVTGQPIDEKRGAEAGMNDLTEFENPDFRYVL